uniref:Fibrinogen C-terminal domain-containing protein n=1 Tax=Amphimedon queenslandica TaxID=400682 RepID=A0A1X7VBB8_AMPQE
MSTDCTNQGTSGSFLLYLRVCCVIDNLGRSVTIKGNGINRYILCPRVLPKSCPSEKNCKDLNSKGSTINGNYIIYPDGETQVEVYCDMNGINCDGEGGWTRVGYLNMTQSGATCPTGLAEKNYTNISHPLCGREASNNNNCNSTTFSSNGLTYNKVCGQVRGYQFFRALAFQRFAIHQNNEDFAVDGVSITHGRNPREHIWTYAGGFSENSTDNRACPCNTGYSGGLDLNATFIGSHYYCESGADSGQSVSEVLYANDPLWDGQQCDGPESTCCPANSKMPWFYRSLDTQTTDDIEQRVCRSRKESGASGVLVDIIELYIK